MRFCEHMASASSNPAQHDHMLRILQETPRRSGGHAVWPIPAVNILPRLLSLIVCIRGYICHWAIDPLITRVGGKGSRVHGLRVCSARPGEGRQWDKYTLHDT